MLRDTADSPTSRAGETSIFLGKYTTRVTPTSRVCPASVEPWRSFWGFFKAPTGGVTSGSTCDTVSEEMRQEEGGREGWLHTSWSKINADGSSTLRAGIYRVLTFPLMPPQRHVSQSPFPPATTEPLTLSLLFFPPHRWQFSVSTPARRVAPLWQDNGRHF